MLIYKLTSIDFKLKLIKVKLYINGLYKSSTYITSVSTDRIKMCALLLFNFQLVQRWQINE